MLPNHQQYIQWYGERFVKWAAKIGINTETAVSAILSGYKIEQQGYKACMGILKLADKYSPERLENACKKALTFTPRPSLNISKSYVSQVFNNTLKISFSECINQLRINEAISLIDSGEPSLSKIAFESGFNSIRSFNRNFYDFTGSTPGDYMKNKQLRNNNCLNSNFHF